MCIYVCVYILDCVASSNILYQRNKFFFFLKTIIDSFQDFWIYLALKKEILTTYMCFCL